LALKIITGKTTRIGGSRRLLVDRSSRSLPLCSRDTWKIPNSVFLLAGRPSAITQSSLDSSALVSTALIP
jgi:hypothetical protein